MLLCRLVWFYGEGLLHGTYKMVVVGLAIWTRYHPTVLAVERQTVVYVDDGASAMLARKSLLTARHGGKDVVRIHRAEEKSTSIPLPFACGTLDVAGTF